jgi:tellurite resistance protein
MIRLLIPVLIMLTALVGIIFPGLLSRLIHKALGFCSRLPHQEEPENFQELSTSIDMSVLNCRIQWIKLEEENNIYDALSVEICGTIQAPNDKCDTTLQISILDVTDGIDQAKVVQSRLLQWSSQDGTDPSAFCYRAGLGKLPDQVTTLSDWTAVAQIRFDWLLFPRKGERRLQFTTSIMSADGNQQLANSQCLFTCENPAFGYMNLQENSERTNILAVALAFAVSAADDRLCDCEIELIKNWARDNILENSASDQDEHKLDKALEKTIDFFRSGNKLDTCMMCDEIIGIAPVAQRYDIMELCLYVAQAKGSVTAEELTLLKNMAGWLEIDPERFHKMMEKILPVSMHEERDIETILGINSDMSREKVRQHLNKEYSKWNSRVTNSDPDIQNQADQMLSLIAEARSHYTTEAVVSQ